MLLISILGTLEAIIGGGLSIAEAQKFLCGLPLYPSQGATVDLWQRSLKKVQ